VEIASRQLPRPPVRCGEALQLRPSPWPPPRVLLQARQFSALGFRLSRWDRIGSDGTPRFPLLHDESRGHGVRHRSCCMDVWIRMLILTFILSKWCPGRLPNGDGQGDSRLVQIWICMISGLFLCLLSWPCPVPRPPCRVPRAPGRSHRLGHRRTLSLKDPWRFPIFWILIRSPRADFELGYVRPCTPRSPSLPEYQWGGVPTSEMPSSPRPGVRRLWANALQYGSPISTRLPCMRYPFLGSTSALPFATSRSAPLHHAVQCRNLQFGCSSGYSNWISPTLEHSRKCQ
jgi:hypothetical protein